MKNLGLKFMINLDNVTLMTIDGVGNDQNAVKALKYSSTHINFASIKYITAGSLVPNFCETIKIPKMSWNQYNKFCLTDLYEYVDSDYIILIQSDGFIINSKCWNDHFLEYDYIGAPWPMENLRCNIPRWPIVLNQALKNKNNYQIGNGGFTLRSKKLLLNTKELYTDSMFELPEDVVISILIREKLESLGLKFVNNINFAASFSCEAKNIDGAQISAEDSFGFHCKDTHADKVSLLNSINMVDLLK